MTATTQISQKVDSCGLKLQILYCSSPYTALYLRKYFQDFVVYLTTFVTAYVKQHCFWERWTLNKYRLKRWRSIWCSKTAPDWGKQQNISADLSPRSHTGLPIPSAPYLGVSSNRSHTSDLLFTVILRHQSMLKCLHWRTFISINRSITPIFWKRNLLQKTVKKNRRT